MDRRGFLRLLGTSALGLLLPIKGEVPAMKYGDRLAKILSDRASPELSELQRELNQMWDDQQVVRGWLQTGQSKIASSAIEFPFALIFSETLATDSATLASIQMPPAYSQIMVVGAARSSYSGVNTNDLVVCRLNGDSGANYDVADIAQLSGASQIAEGLGVTRLAIAYCPVSTSPAGSYGGVWAFIGNLNNGGWKNSFALCGAKLDDPGAPATQSAFEYGAWKSTAHVNSVAVTLESGQNFVAGSHISIYGIQ